MIRVVIALVTLLLGATAWARPAIRQSTESIPSPDPTYTYFGYGLAIDGDWAIITGEKWSIPGDYEFSEITATAFLYRRVNSSWVLQRKLVEQHGSVGYMGPSGLAMREGIAVVLMGGMHIFELSGSDYVARNAFVGGEGLGSDIDISNRRILIGNGDCAWDGIILEWSTVNNRWQNTTTLPGESKDGCDDEFHGGPVEISGDLAWVRGGGVFQRTGGTTWISVPQWTKPSDPVAPVALSGTNAFVAGSGRYGTYVNNRDASGVWTTQDYLRTVDNMYSGGNGWNSGASPEGNLVYRPNYEDPYLAKVINIFRLGSNGKYSHAAQIIAKSGENFNFGFATSGRRVLIFADDAKDAPQRTGNTQFLEMILSHQTLCRSLRSGAHPG